MSKFYEFLGKKYVEAEIRSPRTGDLYLTEHTRAAVIGVAMYNWDPDKTRMILKFYGGELPNGVEAHVECTLTFRGQVFTQVTHDELKALENTIWPALDQLRGL